MSEWSKWVADSNDREVEHKSDYSLFEADMQILRDPAMGWVIVIDEPDTILAVFSSSVRGYAAAILYRKESST
jgi:hypothetical protein